MHLPRSAGAAAAIAVTFFALLTRCEGGPTIPPDGSALRAGVVEGTGSDPTAVCSTVTEVELLAGQTEPIGTVRVGNDEASVYVTVATRDGWTLRQTQLFVGTSRSGIPVSNGGNAVPGQFPYATVHAAGTVEYTYAAPLPEAGGATPVVVALHADVERDGQEAGAWAAGDEITPGKSWGTYLTAPTTRCVSGLVTPEAGGTLTLGALRFDVPPGAVARAVQIRITPIPVSDLNLPPEGFTPSGSTARASIAAVRTVPVTPIAGTAYQLEPEGLVFDKAAQPTLTLPYREEDLPAGTLERNLSLFIIDGVFPRLPSVVDEDANTVTASIPHFTYAFVGLPVIADLETTELTGSQAAARVGVPLEYGATVVNHGPDATTGGHFTYVAFGDVTLDAVFGSCSEIPHPVVGNVAIECAIAPLAAGAADGIEALRIVPRSPGTVEVWATAEWPEGAVDLNPDNDRKTASITVLSDASVDYAVTALGGSAATVKPYTSLTYTATVALHDGPASGVAGGQYQLEIDGQLAVLSTSDPGCSTFSSTVPARQIVTCPLGSLARGASEDFSVEIEPHAAPATLTATATVSAPFGSVEATPADNTRSISTDVAPDLADLYLSGISDTPDPVDVGGTVDYRVYALSPGTADDVAHVAVQFRLTGSATLVSMPSSEPGVTCTDLSSSDPSLALLVTCDIALLQAGIASPPLDFTVQANGGSELAAEAEVFPPDYVEDPDETNDLQTATTEVRAVSSGQTIYVASPAGRTITVIDAATRSVAATIPLVSSPIGLALSPDRSELWVPNGASGVFVVSTASNEVVAGTSYFASIPIAVAFAPDGAHAYVLLSGAPGAVAIVDAADRTVASTTIPVVSNPADIVVTPDGRTAYVSGDAGVSVIDLSTNTVTTTIPLDGHAYDMAVAPDGSAIYVTQRRQESGVYHGYLRTIDRASDAVVGTPVEVGAGALDVVLGSSGSTAYVTDTQDRIAVVDLGAGTVRTIPLADGSTPYGLALTGDEAALWVSLQGADGAVRLDLSTGTPGPTVPTGISPGPLLIR